MEAKKFFFFPYVLALVFLLIGTEVDACQSQEHESANYRKLFVFGDSYADTGNLGRLGQLRTRCWYYPYGMTFPGHPVGRWSNGRVLTDYFASFMGNRSPIPYKYRRIGCKLLPYGMNFALGGTGLFDTGNSQRNMTAQIDLLEEQIKLGVFPKCGLNSSVALVSVSGNDYDHFNEETKGNWSFDQLDAFIASLIKQLKIDLKRIHDLGVGKVVVTNLHPLGCVPYESREFNYTSCNIVVNVLVEEHNGLLQNAVNELRNATDANSFMILDVYQAFWSVIEAKKFKYNLKPCCEAFTDEGVCGQVDEKGVKQYRLCNDPQNALYWDGVHPTEAGWAAIFQALMSSLRKFIH